GRRLADTPGTGGGRGGRGGPVFWLPDRPSAEPSRRCARQWRPSAFVPGHSDGLAPDSHRLPAASRVGPQSSFGPAGAALGSGLRLPRVAFPVLFEVSRSYNRAARTPSTSRARSAPVRVPHLRHQPEQLDHVGGAGIAGELAVAGRDVDGDALGVAPARVVAERDVEGGVADRQAGVEAPARLAVDVGEVVAHGDDRAAVGQRTVAGYDTDGVERE